jgi:nucleotide-binding universal stress UspA family protein
MTQQPIVVGVDGSAASAAALRWAVAEARLRGAPLRLVHAYQPPMLPFATPGIAGAAVPLPSDDVERLGTLAEEHGRSVLAEAVGELGSDADDLDVQQQLVEGPPATMLIAIARGAALLVLGSRGRGGFAGLLLGSVSQQCAQHPPCPVVILPPVDDGRD